MRSRNESLNPWADASPFPPAERGCVTSPRPQAQSPDPLPSVSCPLHHRPFQSFLLFLFQPPSHSLLPSSSSFPSFPLSFPFLSHSPQPLSLLFSSPRLFSSFFF